ncbi:MAG: Asp-tRNA(Asn)/Glu-tRNA(Gln) amidotransferase GatCAB subunit A, partial [Alphaproteobacteria bacterium]
MTAPTDLTLAEARAALEAKEISSRELTEAYLREMELGRTLNAFVAETADKALAMADAADAALAKGEAGPLAGIPLAIKDLFCTHGVHSQASSRILDGFKPPYESTVTANLWRDGAVMLGKVSMDEFAMGSSNETAADGPVINPWRGEGSDKNLVP